MDEKNLFYTLIPRNSYLGMLVFAQCYTSCIQTGLIELQNICSKNKHILKTLHQKVAPPPKILKVRRVFSALQTED